MAQIRWVYASPTQRQYAIGLYHGEKSRHVLLYVNNRISVIDFNVKEDKTYSFFIEEELCELSMQKTDTHWKYDFAINTVIQTPANIVRRKRELRYLIYAIAFLLLFVGLVAFLVTFIFT